MRFIGNLALWLAAGALAGYAFRLLPARWLCDYGETPSAAHAPQQRRLPWYGLAAFALLTALCTAPVALQSGEVTSPLRAVGVSLCTACFVAALLLAAWCDIKYMILPDELLLLCGALALALWALGGLRFVQGSAWYAPFLGAALGFFVLWGVLALAARLYKTEAMGFGDVKLAAALGAFCGAKALGVAALLAVLGAALVLGGLLLAGRLTRKDTAPFGPFLAFGALAAVGLWPLWGALGAWYFSLF